MQLVCEFGKGGRKNEKLFFSGRGGFLRRGWGEIFDPAAGDSLCSGGMVMFPHGRTVGNGRLAVLGETAELTAFGRSSRLSPLAPASPFFVLKVI